jgi:predicted nucleic acid-binding protein
MSKRSRYTVDASVLVKLVVEEEHSENALTLLLTSSKNPAVATTPAPRLYAPDIIFYETASVMYKMARRGIIKHDYALRAYENLLKLPLETIDSKQLPLKDILGMSLRLGMHYYYDCLYIQVAKKTQSILVSSDKQLLAAAGREECEATSLANI